MTITGVFINYIFKREKENIIILKYEIVQVIKNTFTKYNIFIILSIIILVFSLYYAFCFKNIYSSIKGELPIILCLSYSYIRLISFKYKSEGLF